MTPAKEILINAVEKMDRKDLLKLARQKQSLSNYNTDRIRLILVEWINLGVLS